VYSSDGYPAARCAMGNNICMFSKSASSGLESMNKANQLAQQRTAVDILNAVILLIKLEGERFKRHTQKAWERDNQLLTELGLELMEKAFADVDIRDYMINITKGKTIHKCTVSRMKSTSEYTVTILMKDTMGSRFGSCTCGKPTKDGVSCKDMVAIVKASKIKGLSQIQILLYWLTSPHWRAQYAADVYYRTDVLINAVKQPQTLKMTYATVLCGQQEIRKVGPRRISVRRVLMISLRNHPATSTSGEGCCSAISVRSSITPQLTVLRILQINCRVSERHWRVRFRKELQTRICAKGCDISMLNVTRCDIVMVYFQYV
jgi:hypothetical protein